MLDHGFAGDFIIGTHIYKFCEKEMGNLREWAAKEGLAVSAYYSYLAGNSLVVDYFEDRLDKSLRSDISKELFNGMM